MVRLAAAFILILAPIVMAASTEPAGESAADTSGVDIRITIITMGPGDAAWEKFGHIALRIEDPNQRNADVAFNWGLFDFEQKNFYFNFIQGRMIYSTAPEYGDRMLKAYIADGRAIWEQELNLSPRQKLDLEARCRRAIEPDRREYRYDYYKDNCTTRVRDQVDAVIGGEIARQTRGIPTGTTYRWHTRRLTADDLWLYTSLNTLLGHPADQPIDEWEEMFLPTKLREHLREVTLTDTRGRRVPLVLAERQLSIGTKPLERQKPPNFLPGYLAVGVIGGILLILLSNAYLPTRAANSRDPQPRITWKRRVARTKFLLLLTGWLLLISLGGVAIAWCWLFTDHAVAVRNENLFQLTPLAYPLLFWVTSLARRGRRARPALILAATIAGISLLGLALKIFPAFYQGNGELIALALPMHLALLWVVWRLSSARSALRVKASVSKTGVSP